MKSRVQPVRYWVGGRTWSGIGALSAPPGARATAAPPSSRFGRRPAVLDEQPEMLADAEDGLAASGHGHAPYANPGPARAVDGQAGQAVAQGPEQVTLLLVASGARAHEEAPVEGSKQHGSFGSHDLGAGPDQARMDRRWVLAA